jgi:protein disulfide-isomerase A1
MKFFSGLSLKSLTTLLAAVSVGFADEEAIASPDSAVVKLTADKFSSFIKENPLVLAEFFAPWCGHCKALGPNFAAAADELEPKDIKLAQIDCTENQDLCQEHGIKGYPTLKVFRGSESDPADYEGPRSSDGIVKYMLKQALPAVSLINDVAEFEKFLDETDGAVVLETGVEANSTFYEFATTHRDEYSFVQTTNEDLVKKYGKDKILVFVDGSDEPAVFSKDELTLESLDEFVSVESFPYLGEIDGSTYQKYASQKTPLAYFFYNTADERESWAPHLTKLAKENRGKINFVGINAAMFGRHAENLNMKQEFPLFVIHDTLANMKYGVAQDIKLTEAAIEEFINKFIAGEAEAIVKSEEVPEVQESTVFKIVGSTHDKIINDEKKDVLVKYYAPWCGHCKRLAPVYEELADLYANDEEASEKVLIANLDGTLNDVAVEITGYPTLILYPAGDKSNPIVHKGGRDLQSLIDFIKEKGTHGIDATDFEAPKKEEEEEEKKEEKKDERDEL